MLIPASEVIAFIDVVAIILLLHSASVARNNNYVMLQLAQGCVLFVIAILCTPYIINS